MGAKRRILGLGGTVDYELVWDPKALAALARDEAVTGADLTDLPSITSVRELLVSLLDFVDKGGGGERYVTDVRIIEDFTRPMEYRTTLGGTPVRAAIVMAIRGVESTVHLVSTNQVTRELLPPSTRVITSATGDSLFPHLIIQFPAGARVSLADREVVSSRANRLIYTHDPPNEELLLSADLPAALESAEIFLLSGLNIFRDEARLRGRLDDLTTAMSRIPDSCLVYFEDAGFHVPAFSALVRESLLADIDVYSMNEDEAQGYFGSQIDLGSPPEVVALLSFLADFIPVPVLVVHTQRWAVAIGSGASGFAGALQAAVDMSGARYQWGDSLDQEKLDALRRGRRHSDLGPLEQALAERFGADCAFVAGFDLRVGSPTTIGLGDSFAGGFLAQYCLDRKGVGNGE